MSQANERSDTRSLPRLVVAGLAGNSGKTVVTVGLALALRDRGIAVRGFKKGPDYIDAAWMAWATRQPVRNLDTYLMGGDLTRASFTARAIAEGLNLVEGNRGVYDGADARGTHSTAQLARLLAAPVLLVVDVTKVTRTAAACVLGCQAFDPDLRFAGVVLNRVGGSRHERVVREAIEATCELPVLGALPRADARRLLPGRHLGLVTPDEHGATEDAAREIRELTRSLDVDRILGIARRTVPLDVRPLAPYPAEPGPPVRIGYVADSAFTFYYAENLEALEAAGAVLVPVSALNATEVPADLRALYIGGGFPETHAAALASNRPFLKSLEQAATRGLPVYAECGGLMLLSRAIWWHERKYPMAGVLPLDVEVQPTPQGHGYALATVDRPNPFYPEGTALKGHQFHYSRPLAPPAGIPTACAVTRGAGWFDGRDGVVVGQTFATYTHVHALATPEWAPGVVAAARRFANPQGGRR